MVEEAAPAAGRHRSQGSRQNAERPAPECEAPLGSPTADRPVGQSRYQPLGVNTIGYETVTIPPSGCGNVRL
jgi:hypothetical protein